MATDGSTDAIDELIPIPLMLKFCVPFVVPISSIATLGIPTAKSLKSLNFSISNCS